MSARARTMTCRDKKSLRRRVAAIIPYHGQGLSHYNEARVIPRYDSWLTLSQNHLFLYPLLMPWILFAVSSGKAYNVTQRLHLFGCAFQGSYGQTNLPYACRYPEHKESFIYFFSRHKDQAFQTNAHMMFLITLPGGVTLS